MDTSTVVKVAVTRGFCLAATAGAYATANATEEPPVLSSVINDQFVGDQIPPAMSDLLVGQGIKVAPIGVAVAAQYDTGVDAKVAAIKAARAEFGLGPSSQALSATLVALTSAPPAPESEAARREDGPRYVDRVVWLVTLGGVRDTYRGPLQDNVPSVGVGTMVAPVDATSGKVLFAFVA